MTGTHKIQHTTLARVALTALRTCVSLVGFYARTYFCVSKAIREEEKKKLLTLT